MALFTLSIDDPSPALVTLHSEAEYIVRALNTAAQEIGRSQGTVTSGTVVMALGTATGSAGSWTYTPVATAP